MKKSIKLLIVTVLLFVFLFGMQTASYAYSYAIPDTISSTKKETTTIYWVFQYSHLTTINVENSSGQVVKKLASFRYFGSGENRITWDGSTYSGPAPNGTYKVKIIPEDQWRQYVTTVTVTVRNTPEPPPPPPESEPKAYIQHDYKISNADIQNNVPNPFNIMITISNLGDAPAYNTKLTISLPPGLYIKGTNKSSIIEANIGTVSKKGDPKGNSVTRSYEIYASPSRSITSNKNITFSVSYDGGPTGTTSKTVDVLPAKYPVIILPGLTGSWPTKTEDVINPNYSGTWTAGFYFNSFLNPYKKLVDELKNKGYLENTNLFVVAYDWRKRNEDTVKNFLVPALKKAREQFVSYYELPSNADVDMDIIAHSMGGLVARYYLEKSIQVTDVSIRNLVMLGTPNYGAPKAYFPWEGGVVADNKLTSKVTKYLIETYGKYYAKNVANRDWSKDSPGWREYWQMAAVQTYIPSIKQLLPVNKPGFNLYYLMNEDTNTYKDNNSLSEFATNDFLIDLNKSSNLTTLYSRINNKVYTVRGKESTIYSIHVQDTGKAWPRWIDGEPVWLPAEKYDYWVNENGDGTVLWNSTRLPDNNPYTNKLVNYDNESTKSHSFLPEGDDVIKYIFNELGFGIYDKRTSDPTFYMITFYLKCPADLLITDPQGRKIGYLNGQLINQIGENAIIMGQQGDGQFISILNPVQGNYNVSVYGQGEGSYELETWSAINEDVQSEAVFSGYVKPGLKLNYSASFNSAVEQKLVVEMPDTVAPTSTFTLNGLHGQNEWFTTPAEIRFTAVDNPGGVGVAKIEYSLDGGQNWNDYSLPVVLNSSGVYGIKYRSVDFFSNQEIEKSISVKVDLVPPTTNAICNAPDCQDANLKTLR